MTAIAELVVGADAAAWGAAGFAVDSRSICQVGRVRLRLDPDGPAGLRSWVLAGAPDESVDEVDGVATAHGDPSPGAAPRHPVSVTSIDHVVLLTPDLDRTVGAVEGMLGLPLRRTRDGVSYGRPVRQAFFRMGEVILEVVGSPEPDPKGGPARFFGLAFSVESLDEAAAVLGDRLGEPKPAVQEGRMIATVRSAAGLGVPVAFMSRAG